MRPRDTVSTDTAQRPSSGHRSVPTRPPHPRGHRFIGRHSPGRPGELTPHRAPRARPQRNRHVARPGIGTRLQSTQLYKARYGRSRIRVGFGGRHADQPPSPPRKLHTSHDKNINTTPHRAARDALGFGTSPRLPPRSWAAARDRLKHAHARTDGSPRVVAPKKEAERQND